MKKLIKLLSLTILILFSNHSYSQIAPGSVLIDGTDEAFLQSLIVPGTYEGTLLFRMSNDGILSSDFHSACDNQGPTLVIMRNSISGEVFGGYTEENWAGSGYSGCVECFLFNLTHDYSLANSNAPQYSIYRTPGYGPTFGGGHDLQIPGTMNSGGYCNNHSYEYPSGQGHAYLHGGSSSSNMTIDEIEVFAISISLPVELVDFNGRVDLNQIKIEWSTASESSNSGFEIQKSRNSKDWHLIDFIDGQGTSNERNEYKYMDSNPFSGINYFRLKQIDFDGAFEYSKVIAVEYNNSEKNIQVFPNPSNGLTNIQIGNLSNQRMKIKITDSRGRKIWESELIEGESNWRKEMEIEENGIYFVIAQIEDEIFYERVIITGKK